MGPDPYSATNPRQALQRREADAMGPPGSMPAMPPPMPASGVQFSRPPISPAERAAQQAKLAQALAGRRQ